MSKIQKLAMAGTVAAIGLGMGAATASAYSISGGAYTSDRSGSHVFTVGAGAYTISCPTKPGPPITDGAIFNGNATGADNTNFTPGYSNCKFLGFPATVTQSGTWNIKVTSGPDVNGYYYGEITIPASTTTTINVPIAGCTVTVTGHQLFQHGVGANVGKAKNWTSGTGIDLEANATNIVYTKSGSCPFSSGTDGVYSTGGATKIPGVTVS